MTRRPVTKPVKKPANRPPKPVPVEKPDKKGKKEDKGKTKPGKSEKYDPKPAATRIGKDGRYLPPSPLSWMYPGPDLSAIVDANLSIGLKSLQKKDSVTKVRALEDVLAIWRDNAVEDASLDAWLLDVKLTQILLYPRLAIDNSRRVRQLSHEVQGQVAAHTGKHFAPRMPEVIGVWLAGLYDSDKGVARAAKDSFKLVFPTEDKYLAIWQVYQSVLVDFVVGIIQQETAATLSDERISTPDDMTAKFDRVANAAVSMACDLLNKLQTYIVEMKTDQIKTKEAKMPQDCDQLHELLTSPDPWRLSSSGDASLRKSTYALLEICFSRYPEDLDPVTLSASLLTDSLPVPQTSSSLAYVSTLIHLTTRYPSVWSESYNGIGRKYSTRRLAQFLRRGSCAGPKEFWPRLVELMRLIPKDVLLGPKAEDILEYFAKRGIHTFEVLNAFREGVTIELRANASNAWQAYLEVCSLFLQHLDHPEGCTELLKVYVLPLLVQTDAENSLWNVPSFASAAISVAACRLLRPEMVNEHISNTSNRLIEDIQRPLPEQSREYRQSQDTIAATATRWHKLQQDLSKEVRVASTAQLLAQQHTLELQAAMKALKSHNGRPYGAAALLEAAAGPDEISAFTQQIPSLVNSPSGPYLVRMLVRLKTDLGPVVDAITRLAPIDSAEEVIRILLSTEITDETPQKSLVLHLFRQALNDQGAEFWPLVLVAIKNVRTALEIKDKIMSTLVSNVSLENPSPAVLYGLQILGQEAIRQISSDSQRSILTAKLLQLTDLAGQDIAEQAETVRSTLALTSLSGVDQLREILMQNFAHADATSLSMEILLDQADQILNVFHDTAAVPTNSDDHHPLPDPVSLLPLDSHWQKAFLPFFTQAPDPTLAITSSFPLLGHTSGPTMAGEKDGRGESLLLRLVDFTVSLAERENMPVPAVTVKNVAVAAEILTDKLMVPNEPTLWDDDDAETWIEDLLHRTTTFLSDTVNVLPDLLEEINSSVTPRACYHARAFVQSRVQSQKAGISSDFPIPLDGSLRSMALLYSTPANAASLKILNTLLTSPQPDLRTISALLTNAEELLQNVPSQRLVLFVQRAVFSVDALDVLAKIVPFIESVYGEFWSEILLRSRESLDLSRGVVEVHAALHLLFLCHGLGNDDLVDAFVEQRTSISHALIALMYSLETVETNQPLRKVFTLIGNMCSRMAIAPEDLPWSLISAKSEQLQLAAYGMLRRSIQGQQEQNSLEKALDAEFKGQLPSNVLENLKDSPYTRRTFLSWQLIFDHWTHASYALQADYVKIITEGNYLGHLLPAIFETLVTDRQRPFDASKAKQVDLQNGYDEDGLLVQLYHFCLLHLASSVKSWWRDDARRHLKQPAQSWTEKYMSPGVILEDLSGVKEWSSKEDDGELTVKVSIPAREIVASIPVDEQATSISIHLPTSYPLTRAEVRGNHRVAVPEAKWQNWLRNAQGQLTTSDGGSNSLIDCLLAWKRNVTAAMKGQTECAICYSVVAADKTLPKKKCPTCKNCFHAGCLFRWFKSSNSSSCPLCRKTFHY